MDDFQYKSNANSVKDFAQKMLTREFWQNPQNWIYAGVAAIAVIGIIAVFANYQRPRTEAEIKAAILESLRAPSNAPQVSAEEKAKILQSLSAPSTAPKVSAEEKAKILQSLSAPSQ